MSQQYNQYFGSDHPYRQLARDEALLMRKAQAKSATYNPCNEPVKDETSGKILRPNTIYVDLHNNGSVPHYDDAAVDMNVWKEGVSLYRQGKINADKAIFSPYLGEWQDRQNDYLEAIKATYRTAGTITTDDFSAINVVNVLAEVIGTDIRQYSLEGAVTKMNVPGLKVSIDTFTKFTVSQDVSEGVTVPTKKGAFTRQDIALKKDVGHIALTDEAQMVPLEHPIYQIHVDNAVNDLRRIKAKKIATELEAASDVGGADWAAYTSDHSTTNPFDQIGALSDTILANDGVVNTLASHDKPYRDYLANTHISRYGVTPANQVLTGARVVNNVAGYPGLDWYIDNELTATILTVYDRRAIVLAQGPTRSAQYRLEDSGIDAYIIRDWNAVKTIQSGWIRNLTGVTA